MPQYDPYGQQQPTTGDVVKDFVTSPFRVSTYTAMYGTMPMMWSPSKGIYLPGVGRTFQHGFKSGIKSIGSAVSNMYKAGGGGVRGAVSATWGVGKKGFGKAMRFGLGAKAGGGYIGGTFLKQASLAQELYDDVFSQVLSRAQKAGASGAAARSTAAKAAERALEKVPSGAKRISSRAAGQHLGRVNIKKKFLTGLKGADNLVNKRLLGKLAKFGLGAAKVGSVIGGVLLTKDLIEMVGVPLGRAAVQTLDNTFTRYQERFMPEMGGQLELSYLSRGAATERQRAVQAISKAYINGRSAIGNEAQYIHQ